MKRFPQVGFDFDQPIYPWNELAHVASVKAGLCAKDLPFTGSWTPWEIYECEKQAWYDVIDNEILNGDMYLQPIDPKIVELFRRMYRRGYGIHIVTARGNFGPLGEQIKDITKSQILKAGLPYDTLNFTLDKVATALHIGLDYMLDDHVKYHDPLTAAGVNSYLMDQPYNQNHPEKWHPVGKRVADVFAYGKIVMDTELDPGKMTPAQRTHVIRETV